jgi:hypothetical protein
MDEHTFFWADDAIFRKIKKLLIFLRAILLIRELTPDLEKKTRNGEDEQSPV